MQFNPNIDPNHPTRSGQPRFPVTGILSELVFGRSIPAGGNVSDYAVQAFLDSFVLPRFPGGFTVTESRGVWRGGNEDSFSVSVVYGLDPAERRDAGVKLEECRAEYIRLHGQDSVLRIETPVTYSFD